MAGELPDWEVGPVTGCTGLEIQGDLGSGGLHGGRMVPLRRASLGGWHLLPLVCDGCSRILPDLDLLGTKLSVLTSGVSSLGSAPLADGHAALCIGACVKQAFCIFKCSRLI